MGNRSIVADDKIQLPMTLVPEVIRCLRFDLDAQAFLTISPQLAEERGNSGRSRMMATMNCGRGHLRFADCG